MQNALIKREQVHWIDGEPFFTSETLGDMLGYKNPRRSINYLYNQNRDEFEGLIGVIDLMTPGGIQKTVAFNEEGAYLVTMLAKTDKAKAARRSIALLLREIRRKQFVSREEYQRVLTQLGYREIKEYLRTASINRDEFDDIVGYFYSHNLSYSEISRIMGIGKMVIGRALKMYRKIVSEEQLPDRIKRTNRPIGVCRGTSNYKQLLLPGIGL